MVPRGIAKTKLTTLTKLVHDNEMASQKTGDNTMPSLTTLLRAALPLLSLAAAPFAAAADAYPSKPIRMVVPFAAGSGTDAVAQIGRAHV